MIYFEALMISFPEVNPSPMLEGIKNFFKRADLLLLALCIAANTFGLILVYSATRFQSTYHSLPRPWLWRSALWCLCCAIMWTSKF